MYDFDFLKPDKPVTVMIVERDYVSSIGDVITVRDKVMPGTDMSFTQSFRRDGMEYKIKTIRKYECTYSCVLSDTIEL